MVDERLLTMQRVRLGFVAVAALIGTVALSGCQRDPDTALKIGDVTMDNAQVEAAAEHFAARLADSPAGIEDPVGAVRQSVVQLTVFNELARRYAQEKGIAVPAADYAASAQALGAPAEDPYVRLSAETSAYANALRGQATSQKPTEADMQEAYARYVELAGDNAAPYDQIRDALLELPEYSQSLGLRTELLAALDRYGLTVNPRYTPLDFPLFSVSQGQLVLVNLPMGDQGTPVRTAS
jgi:hypothetical protein